MLSRLKKIVRVFVYVAITILLGSCASIPFLIKLEIISLPFWLFPNWFVLVYALLYPFIVISFGIFADNFFEEVIL